MAGSEFIAGLLYCGIAGLEELRECFIALLRDSGGDCFMGGRIARLRYCLIAGFIGADLALRFMEEKRRVSSSDSFNKGKIA